MMNKHFGDMWNICPMSGKRAPALVAGKLAALIEELWDGLKMALRETVDTRGMAPLTGEEWELLIENAESAKGCVLGC